MGLPSPRTLQSQGHLGKRRDTDAVSEGDGERRWGGGGELVMEKRWAM